MALAEDVGSGDLTASLVPDVHVSASVLCRQRAVICGTALFDEVFSQVDKNTAISWRIADGAQVERNQILCTIKGAARAILTAERAALNLLQTLSGTATTTREYVDAIAHTTTRIVDTRKTLPGLRLAQKYAVRCGGGHNHRLGLYDGILIKENHLRSGVPLAQIVSDALNRIPASGLVEVEVTNIDELKQALTAGAPRILLDNFSTDDINLAVTLNAGQAELEASGGIEIENVKIVAETGVDLISIGALTKDLKAVDLSLLVEL